MNTQKLPQHTEDLQKLKLDKILAEGEGMDTKSHPS